MYVSALCRTEGTGEWEGESMLDDYNKMDLQILDVEYELEEADAGQSLVAVIGENVVEFGDQLNNCQLLMVDGVL
jgi:hypothetical protein